MELNPCLKVLGRDKYMALPVLQVGHRVGKNDVIDFIVDIPFPLMRGTDIYKRPFVAIKILVDDTPQVGVFFQRWSNRTTEWAVGTCYPIPALHYDSRVRLYHLPTLHERLRRLLKGHVLKAFDLAAEPDYVVGNSCHQVRLYDGTPGEVVFL